MAVKSTKKPSSLLKRSLAGVFSLATVAALGAGGWWGYSNRSLLETAAHGGNRPTSPNLENVVINQKIGSYVASSRNDHVQIIMPSKAAVKALLQKELKTPINGLWLDRFVGFAHFHIYKALDNNPSLATNGVVDGGAYIKNVLVPQIQEANKHTLRSFEKNPFNVHSLSLGGYSLEKNSYNADEVKLYNQQLKARSLVELTGVDLQPLLSVIAATPPLINDIMPDIKELPSLYDQARRGDVRAIGRLSLFLKGKNPEKNVSIRLSEKLLNPTGTAIDEYDVTYAMAISRYPENFSNDTVEVSAKIALLQKQYTKIETNIRSLQQQLVNDPVLDAFFGRKAASSFAAIGLQPATNTYLPENAIPVMNPLHPIGADMGQKQRLKWYTKDWTISGLYNDSLKVFLEQHTQNINPSKNAKSLLLTQHLRLESFRQFLSENLSSGNKTIINEINNNIQELKNINKEQFKLSLELEKALKNQFQDPDYNLQYMAYLNDAFFQAENDAVKAFWPPNAPADFIEFVASFERERAPAALRQDQYIHNRPDTNDAILGRRSNMQNVLARLYQDGIKAKLIKNYNVQDFSNLVIAVGYSNQNHKFNHRTILMLQNKYQIKLNEGGAFATQTALTYNNIVGTPAKNRSYIKPTPSTPLITPRSIVTDATKYWPYAAAVAGGIAALGSLALLKKKIGKITPPTINLPSMPKLPALPSMPTVKFSWPSFSVPSFKGFNVSAPSLAMPKFSLSVPKITLPPNTGRNLAVSTGIISALGILGASAWFIKENIPSTQTASVPSPILPSPIPTPILTPVPMPTPVVPTPPPSAPGVFDALKDFTDKVTDFPNQVLGLKYGATPASSDSFDVLKAAMANGGDAKGGEPAKAVRAALEKMAQEYNAQRPGLNLNADEMLKAYRKGRDAAAADVPSRINGAFSELEKHISLKQANASLPTTNLFTSLIEHIKETFRNPIEIASGNPGMMSDMGGYLPRQDGIFAAASQHLQHFAKATQEAVASTMHHASDAVGHAWNSEPVQSALHSSATYTAVSLLATGAGVRLSTVLEARKAEAAPTDPPKNLGERFLRMAQTSGEIARDFFTKGDISLQSHLDQFKKPQTILASVRTAGLAFTAVSPAAAVVAATTTAAGVSSLAARVVHAATKDKQGFEKVAAASKYMADMKYLTDATAYAATTTKTLAANTSKAFTEQKQNLTKAYQETTKNIQHTMSTVQHTVTGFLQGMANRFKMA